MKHKIYNIRGTKYAHSDDYIVNIVSNGFKVIDSQKVGLRKEKGSWIEGKIFILQLS